MKPNIQTFSLVPYVISATGHRDLRPQDLVALRSKVRLILQGMRERMPHTPLILLTGLAEGADQLIAEVAMNVGISVVAALPMPLDIYRTTMLDEAREKLDSLLEKSAFQVPLRHPLLTHAMVQESEAARVECYEYLARFLAHHCQALIALWDGRPSVKPGGTARVVEYVSTETPRSSEHESDPHSGIVYHVVTPRTSGQSLGNALTIQLLHSAQIPGRGLVRKKTKVEHFTHLPFAQVEKNIEIFNKRAAKWPQHTHRLHSRLISVECGRRPLPPFMERIETLYGQADAISLRASGWRRRFFYAIFVFIALGTLLYGAHADIYPEYVALWLSLPLSIAIALGIHQVARRLHVEDEYLDARALAEALRVQFFWEVAGVIEPVDNHYLVHHQTEMDWIRAALRNVWLMRSDPSNVPLDPPDLALALNSWILDQARWYKGRAEEQALSVVKRERLSQATLWGAFVWSIIIPVSLLLPDHWPVIGIWRSIVRPEPIPCALDSMPPPAHLYGLLHFLLVVPALLAGGYRLWIEQSGYAEQAREYHYMATEFMRKAVELKQSLDETHEACKIVREIGIEALKENGRWLLLHRERPLQVVGSA